MALLRALDDANYQTTKREKFDEMVVYYRQWGSEAASRAGQDASKIDDDAHAMVGALWETVKDVPPFEKQTALMDLYGGEARGCTAVAWAFESDIVVLGG